MYKSAINLPFNRIYFLNDFNLRILTFFLMLIGIVLPILIFSDEILEWKFLVRGGNSEVAMIMFRQVFR